MNNYDKTHKQIEFEDGLRKLLDQMAENQSKLDKIEAVMKDISSEEGKENEWFDEIIAGSEKEQEQHKQQHKEIADKLDAKYAEREKLGIRTNADYERITDKLKSDIERDKQEAIKRYGIKKDDISKYIQVFQQLSGAKRALGLAQIQDNAAAPAQQDVSKAQTELLGILENTYHTHQPTKSQSTQKMIKSSITNSSIFSAAKKIIKQGVDAAKKMEENFDKGMRKK